MGTTDEDQQRQLAARIAAALSEQMGFDVHVESNNGALRLSGAADSAEARADVEQTVHDLAPGVRIENHITIATAPAGGTGDAYADVGQIDSDPSSSETVSLEATGESDLDPGFTDQPLETNPSNASDESVPDLDAAAEPDPTYFAPTDPVVGTDDEGGPEVIGGFDATSMDSDALDRSVEDGQPGDEAVADAVRRELHEDAETTDLAVEVEVEEGVVHLRGRVPSLDDVVDAEEVAGRVLGVREVVDELDVGAP